MERITGPVNGFFIATYACDTGGSSPSYLGYSKICRGRPDSYWDAHCCAKISGSHSHSTPQEALLEAERRAWEQTGNLVPFTFAKPPVVHGTFDGAS
jgi:hypothetical protein